MTETPQDLYQKGDLTGAIEALIQRVKARPADVNQRGLLVEMLCFAGNIERADLQLDAMVKQDPDSAVGVALLRQVLRGEQARRQYHLEGRLPTFLDAPTEHMELLLQASIALREGNLAEALDLASEAEATRQPVAGRLDDVPFDDFRDLNDMLGGVLEVLTTDGKYYWVPLERVVQITFRPPQRPRDLIWRRAELSVADGPEGEVFIPALYVAASEAELDDQARLGRTTVWIGDETTPVRGVGQRVFLVGDQDIPIMDLQAVEFDRANS
jgi:type VI secretion system protein ImpE